MTVEKNTLREHGCRSLLCLPSGGLQGLHSALRALKALSSGGALHLIGVLEPKKERRKKKNAEFPKSANYPWQSIRLVAFPAEPTALLPFVYRTRLPGSSGYPPPPIYRPVFPYIDPRGLPSILQYICLPISIHVYEPVYGCTYTYLYVCLSVIERSAR